MKRKNTIVNTTYLCLGFIIVAVLLWGVEGKHPHNKTDFLPTIPKDTLRSGDIVFRQGTGLTSRIVQTADKNGEYSHVGIVLRDKNGDCMVIHAVPDEPDYKGDVDRVKLEHIDVFFGNGKAVCGAVMRVNADSARACRAATHALDIFKRNTLFDHEYDMSDTTQMYCTELVYFVYRKEGITLADIENTLVIPIINKKCLLPGDLLESYHLSMLIQF